MATWHQQQRSVRLFHDTKWTVVCDPPNDCRTLTLFDGESEAREYASRAPHSYVLRPARLVD